MAAQPAWRSALPILRHADFRNFVVGRVATNLSWQMLEVAVAWQVYGMTHDPLALGLVGLCEFLPFVSLILVGGHVADHVNRRRIIMTTAMIEGLCALSLLWITLAGVTRPWPVYVAIGIFGTTRAFWAPAMQAFLVNIVPREEFAAAAALDSLLRQSAVILGPALGGMLYVFGARVVYASCAGLFIVTVLLMWQIRVQLPVLARNVRPLHERGHELLEGLHHVMRNPVVLGCISLDLFAVLLGGAVALLPIFAAEILHTGPVGLGLLRSAPAVGGAVVGVWLALRPLRDHAGAWMFGGVAVFGVATIVFGLSTTFIVSLLALVVAGAGDMISVYIRTVLVQLNTPDSIRGRVSAVNSMFIGASNELGAFESGVMARLMGTVPSVVVGGMATLAVVAAWMRWFPQLRRMPSLR
jgi:MFS family permease